MPRLVKQSAKKKASPRGGDARRSLKRTIGMEIAALQKLQSSLASLASSAKLEAILQILARTEGSRHHIGHGKKRPCRAQSRRNLCLHRNARPVRPSQRSQPWRSGHDHKKRRDPRLLMVGRKRKNLRTSSPIRAASRFPSFSSRHGGAAPSPQHADITLLLPKVEEACPIGLAPTSSVILQMALGDALAIALLEKSGFTSKHFKDLHPGGALGAGLQSVSDIMHTGAQIPLCPQKRLMSDVPHRHVPKRLWLHWRSKRTRRARRNHHRWRSQAQYERQYFEKICCRHHDTIPQNHRTP